jgi:hypothetical protein
MPFKPGQSGNPNGRPRGSLNKFAVKTAQKVAESGMTPIDYLVSVYRDETVNLRERVLAARAAAPYVHPKLSNVELDLSSSAEKDAVEMTNAELIAIVAGGRTAARSG